MLLLHALEPPSPYFCSWLEILPLLCSTQPLNYLYTCLFWALNFVTWNLMLESVIGLLLDFTMLSSILSTFHAR